MLLEMKSEMQQVEGKNPVLELLRSDTAVDLIQLGRGLEEESEIQEILRLARARNIHVRVVHRDELRRLSRTGMDQGVIAFSALSKYTSLKTLLENSSEKIFIMVLDGLQDPQNLGSVLRSAEATNVNMVVIPKKSAVGLTPAVHRASMGGSAYVPVSRENLFSAIKLLKQHGILCIGVDPAGNSDYFDVNLTRNLALVIGGEDQGISPTLLRKCDGVVRIPMLGHITSLNVGVASALVMYERVRQLKMKR
jgi:23S rRNA (guanosine2251-2'-O)-methyltransferase